MGPRHTHINRYLARIAPVAVLVVAGLAAGPPVSATGPAGNGRIAFVSGGGQLFVMDSDGSNIVDITPTGCSDAYEPDWQPGGDRIAYINRCGPSNTFDISTIQPDGTGFASLVATDVDDDRPAYSPDGQRIAYNRALGDGDLYVAAADGSDPVRVTKAPGRDDCPSWSPDGEQIAFCSNRSGHYQIYVMDADGSDMRRLTHSDVDDKFPEWSPDGGRILFSRGPGDDSADLYWMRVDGSRVKRLTHDGVSLFPAWSPDATQIAFSDNGQVAVMNADGTGEVTLASGTQPAWEPTTDTGAASIWVSVPARAEVGQRISLAGKLTVPGAASSSRHVQVFARPANGDKKLVGNVTTGNQGGFTFGTRPNVKGAWTYQVVWPGDATRAGASFQTTFTVTAARAALVLRAPQQLDVGDSATVTAQLRRGPARAVVSIYAQAADAQHPRLVKRGRVDRDGALEVKVAPRTNTEYWASTPDTSTWDGVRTDSTIVKVHAVWKASSIGGYTTSGKYRLYHYRDSCTTRGYHKECAQALYTLRPRRPGLQVGFVDEWLWHGRWYSREYTFKTSRQSRLLVWHYYNDRDIIGVRHRERVTFRADDENAGASSRWVYWMVTE